MLKSIAKIGHTLRSTVQISLTIEGYSLRLDEISPLIVIKFLCLGEFECEDLGRASALFLSDSSNSERLV